MTRGDADKSASVVDAAAQLEGVVDPRQRLPDMLDNRSVPPMGMTGHQFRKAACAAIDDIENYYANLATRPVIPSIAAGHFRKLIPAAPPHWGEDWQEIEHDLENKILPGMTHWQSPRFMAFFPASSTYPGILGELWSAALTVPAFNWICSPVVTELETIVLDWLAQILNLPDKFSSHGEGGGVINGSASEAIVTVMVAARERFVRRQILRENISDPIEAEDRACQIRSQLVALGSDQAHSSTQKAAIIAGTRFRSISTRASCHFALQASDLRKKIEEVKSRGLEPFYLTVSIGTTSTCAVDDMIGISKVAKDYPDIWIHCDAAYAGSALVVPEYQVMSRELAFVDSFNVNMHKWLLTNFDASCLFVDKRRELTDTFSVTPAYLRNEHTDSGLVTDYRDWQIALGRRFRALKLWFVIRTWGVDGLRRHISHHLQLGQMFADLLRSRPDLFTILTPPRFALTVFALQKDQETNLPGAKVLEPDRPTVNFTERLYTLINDRKDFFLTSSIVGGKYAIRVVSANPLAEAKYVCELFNVLVQTTIEILK